MFSSSKKFKNFRNFPNMRILKINSGFHCNEFPIIEVVQVNANGCDTRDSYLQLKIVSVSFPLRVYHLPNKTSPDSFIFVNPCNSMYYASRKLRNESNRQIWPWNVEWSRAKTNKVLPRKCTGHSKHPLPTTQEKTLHMDITWWSTPKSDYILCSRRLRRQDSTHKASNHSP